MVMIVFLKLGIDKIQHLEIEFVLFLHRSQN